MKNTENLYFPFFYNYYDITSCMSDEEFGRLIRIVTLNLRGEETEVPRELLIAYNFIYDDAMRMFKLKNSASRKRQSAEAEKREKQKDREKEKERYGDFDAELAFKNALIRTYGKE